MSFADTVWNAAEYKNFLQTLKNLADPQYKAFHERLCKTSRAEILGVRSPETKRIAKEIAKGDAAGFLALAGDTYYEELLIKGFVLAFLKKPLGEKREQIDAFIPQIDNWAVCDSFCAALKPKRGEEETLYRLCLDYLSKTGEYERRAAIVLLMDHLVTDAYTDRIFSVLSNVTCDCYYVHMAVAWCVQVCFVKQKEKTLAFFKTNALDVPTHNKAIQKINESNRVTKEDKALVRTLKRA